MIIDALLDAVIDTVKLLPFLYITYLAMEYLESRTSSGLRDLLTRSGKYGPVLGGLSGLLPQCGFSAMASSLYSGRVITVGTLLAVYLATSDEMIPILISEHAPITMMLSILLTKAVIGISAGLIVNGLHNRKARPVQADGAKSGHEHEDEDHHGAHDHGGESILLSALRHSAQISLYILLFTFCFNIVLALIGEDTLRNFMVSFPVGGEMIAALVGLIPNCAASILITELYLNSMINAGCLISGLLCSAGIGLFLLFETNKPLRSSIKIAATLYTVSVGCGILINLLGITF